MIRFLEEEEDDSCGENCPGWLAGCFVALEQGCLFLFLAAAVCPPEPVSLNAVFRLSNSRHKPLSLLHSLLLFCRSSSPRPRISISNLHSSSLPLHFTPASRRFLPTSSAERGAAVFAIKVLAFVTRQVSVNQPRRPYSSFYSI